MAPHFAVLYCFQKTDDEKAKITEEKIHVKNHRLEQIQVPPALLPSLVAVSFGQFINRGKDWRDETGKYFLKGEKCTRVQAVKQFPEQEPFLKKTGDAIIINDKVVMSFEKKDHILRKPPQNLTL